MFKGRELIPRNQLQLSPFTVLQDEMNRLLNNFSVGALSPSVDWEGDVMQMPAVNVIDKGNAIIVEAEVAGLDPKNVNVEIVNGFLTIRGARHEEKEERDKQGSYLRHEISSGTFVRTVALPEGADGDKAEATFKNGLLSVTLPKKPGAREKAKKIAIKTV